MIDWIKEAKYFANNPQEKWIIARGSSLAMDNFLSIVGTNSIFTVYSKNEFILAILFYNEFINNEENI